MVVRLKRDDLSSTVDERSNREEASPHAATFARPAHGRSQCIRALHLENEAARL